MSSLLKTTLRWFTDGAQHVYLHGVNHLGTLTALRTDTATGALVGIEIEHNKVHAGSSFRYTDSVTLASGSTQDYVLTVPNTTKWPHFTFAADGTAATTFQVYRATDRAGTTLQNIFNANENSTLTAGMTIHKGSSGGTTDGTLIFTYSGGLAAGGGGGGASIEGASTYASERILKQNTKYIIRITSGTADNKCNFRAEWYEHTSLTA